MSSTAHTWRGRRRVRVIDAGVIEPAGSGYVDFAIPDLRDYLREHAARYETGRRAKGAPLTVGLAT